MPSSPAGAGFGGIAPGLRYYEFELDSLDANRTDRTEDPVTDRPVFGVGGKKPLSNIAGLKIIEAQIPFSYYVFTAANSSFLLTESGYSSHTITIPPGNYTSATLAAALEVQMQPSGVGSHWTYNVTYNTQLQKLFFATNNTGGGATSEPFTLTFGAAGDRGTTNPRLFLGFPAGASTSLVFSEAEGDVLVAPYAASLSGPNYLYVCSNRMGNLTNVYLPDGASNGGNAGPQMAKIPVNTNAGGVIYWSDPDVSKYFDLENLANLSEVDFYLTLGNDPAPISLNGLSFSLKLALVVNEFDASDISSGMVQTSKVLKRLRMM